MKLKEALEEIEMSEDLETEVELSHDTDSFNGSEIITIKFKEILE